MEVKIRKLRPGAVTPRRGSADAAGYDLYACPADGQSVTIAPHTTAMIARGLPSPSRRGISAACSRAAALRPGRGCARQTASA